MSLYVPFFWYLIFFKEKYEILIFIPEDGSESSNCAPNISLYSHVIFRVGLK